MNLNKNISIWRGDSTPPTNYHFWIKSNGQQFTFNGEKWVNYIEDIPTASSESKGLMSSQDKINLEECVQHLEDTSNPHQVSKEQIGLSNVTNDAQVKRSELGVTVATLNDNGKVSESQLPSYIDDILEGRLISATEFTLNEGQHGEVKQTGVIYLDTTTNTSYRWSGSIYVKISSPIELGTVKGTALEGSNGINRTEVIRTNDHVNIGLIRYSGDKLPISIPFSTQEMAGVMSTSDKIVVDRANILINNNPLVDKLQFAVISNKRYLKYKKNSDSSFTNISIPVFGEKLSVTSDSTLTGCTINLLALDNSVINSATIPTVSNGNNGVMSTSMYADLVNTTNAIPTIQGSIESLNNSTINTYNVSYNSDSVNVALLTNGSDPIEASIEAATTTTAGIISASDKTKLDELDWYFEE